MKLKKSSKKIGKLIFSSTLLAFSVIIMLGIRKGLGLDDLTPIWQIIVGVIGFIILGWIGKKLKVV